MIIALGNIKHDGTLFEKGQEISGLSPEQSAKLIADGVAEDSTKVVAKEEVAKAAESIEKETQEEIASVEVKPTMSRTRLMGIARQRQIAVPQEATRNEIYKLLKAAGSATEEVEAESTGDEEATPPQE